MPNKKRGEMENMKRFLRLLGLSVLSFAMMGNTVFADIAPEKEIVQMASQSYWGIFILGIIFVLAEIILIFKIRGKRK